MTRPDRTPPACMLVRPEKTIITSLPKCSCCFCMPRPRPSPAATIRVMEIMPQAMPNMVSKVRRLCANSVAMVSLSRSRNVISASLLQDHLLLLVESRGNLRLLTIGDSELHRNLFLSVVRLRFGNFHRGLAVLVINQRRFRHHQHVLFFFQHDFRVGAHVGFQFAG